MCLHKCAYGTLTLPKYLHSVTILLWSIRIEWTVHITGNCQWHIVFFFCTESFNECNLIGIRKQTNYLPIASPSRVEKLIWTEKWNHHEWHFYFNSIFAHDFSYIHTHTANGLRENDCNLYFFSNIFFTDLILVSKKIGR